MARISSADGPSDAVARPFPERANAAPALPTVKARLVSFMKSSGRLIWWTDQDHMREKAPTAARMMIAETIQCLAVQSCISIGFFFELNLCSL
jgi:hypothetical protein